MNIDAYRYKPPKPNYLPNDADIDEPIVEDLLVPLDRASEHEDLAYYNKMKRAAHD